MRASFCILFCCLLASNSLAQRGGGFHGGGGGFHGGGGGFHGGGGGFHGGGGGFHGGPGGFHGGVGGFHPGFYRPFIGYRGWGYRAGYAYPAWGFGFPYWPVYPAYNYGSYPTYPLYPPYYSSPNVMVVYPQQPPSVVYVPDTRAPETTNLPSGSPMYLMALQDHTIRAAIAYWVDGPTLHYVTLEHEKMEVPLASVDRDLTRRLNREKNVAVELPEPSRAPGADNHLLVQQADVTFAFNSSDLDDTAKSTLDLIIRRIAALPQPVIELTGFTDKIGSKSYNLALSHRRAEAVQRYMVLRNVPLRYIHIIGLGEEPVPQGLAANREASDLKAPTGETIPALARSVHIQVYPAGRSEAARQQLP